MSQPKRTVLNCTQKATWKIQESRKAKDLTVLFLFWATNLNIADSIPWPRNCFLNSCPKEKLKLDSSSRGVETHCTLIIRPRYELIVKFRGFKLNQPKTFLVEPLEQPRYRISAWNQTVDSIIVANFRRNDGSLSFQVFAQQINTLQWYSLKCLHAWFWFCFWKIHFASLLQNCVPKFFHSTQHFLRHESLIVFTKVENYLPPFFSFSQSPQILKLLGSHFHHEHPCVLCVSKGVKLESNFESYFGLELRKKSRGHGIESVRRDFSVNFGAQTIKSSVKTLRFFWLK